METERSPEHELAGDLARTLRVAAGSALGVAQRRANQTAQAARAGERQQAQTSRALATQIDAQHHSDRSQWQATRRAGWWDQATETDVVAAWSAGVAWAHEDPDAEAAVQEMHSTLNDRYQIDVDQPDTDARDDHDTASALDTDPDQERVNRLTTEAHPSATVRAAAASSVDTARRRHLLGRRPGRGADQGR